MPSATLTELVSNHPELRLSGDPTTRVTGMQYD
ncbi:MAG: hypothetical protein QOF33_3336, partial [Thermomicrobiales bacterium]|nr:hypothetical protein [Thermomicrobiales bacterium]